MRGQVKGCIDRVIGQEGESRMEREVGEEKEGSKEVQRTANSWKLPLRGSGEWYRQCFKHGRKRGRMRWQQGGRVRADQAMTGWQASAVVRES